MTNQHEPGTEGNPPGRAAPPIPKYTVTHYGALGSRDRVLSVWRGCWSQQQDGKGNLGEKFDWYYIGNPAGETEVFELMTNGQSVGMTVNSPRQLVFNGKTVTAGMSMDFVVDPKHRKFYPAKLLQQTFQDVTLRHTHLLYGIPNERARAFLRRAKIGTYEFSRPYFTTILRTAPYLRRYLPNWIALPAGAVLDLALKITDRMRMAALPAMHSEWQPEFDARFDELWHRVKKVGAIGVRDRNFLTWRFQEQPGRKHLILAVTSQGQPGALQAYFVTELQDGVLAVRDTLSTGTVADQTAAWYQLRLAARQLGARTITCHIACGKDCRLAMEKAWFRVRGETVMFYTPRPELDCPESRLVSFWHVTEADEDI